MSENEQTPNGTPEGNEPTTNIPAQPEATPPAPFTSWEATQPIERMRASGPVPPTGAPVPPPAPETGNASGGQAQPVLPQHVAQNPQAFGAPAPGPAGDPAESHGQHVAGSSFAAPATPAKPASAVRRFTASTMVIGMVAAALVGGASAVGASYLMNPQMQSSSVQTPGGSIIVNNTSSVTAVTAAAAKASPSVVTIDVTGKSASGSGSGIILDTEGHILTNTHVVTLGGTTAEPSIAVQTSDGVVHEATLVGTDPLSDLAIIKIEGQGLVPATLGDSNKVNVGDTAIAIGAPLGLSGTVTDGIISTLNRTIAVASSAVPKGTVDGQSNGNGDDQFNFQFPGAPSQGSTANQGSIYINVLQTDAAINHGNSGGALVDSEGRIIGVNVAIASAGSSSSSSSDSSGSIGVGFAIPIDYAQRIAQDLIKNGEATHGLLGVTVQAKPAEVKGGNSSFSVGAEIQTAPEGTPAAKAGLKAGDVITGVNGRPISDSQSLTAAVREAPAGSTVSVTYTRNGQQASVDVTVGSTPAS